MPLPVNQLSFAQEQEIVADPRLLFVTWLVVVNRATLEDIVRDYRFTEREVLNRWLRCIGVAPALSPTASEQPP
ncbi:MAG TPA: hypothetical protein VGT07_08975 [Steroidobacteraceae bacterium]|nr:hypothetical protein [Steroidobacteraceae bacterium]